MGTPDPPTLEPDEAAALADEMAAGAPGSDDEFAAIDQMDSEQIDAHLDGTHPLLGALFYRFTIKRGKSKGKEVVGISWAAVNAAALHMGRHGNAIHMSDLRVEETVDDMRVTVLATCKEGSRYGGFNEPLLEPGDPKSSFTFRYALSKAQRNAIKPLIPMELLVQLYAAWKASQQRPAREITVQDDRTAVADSPGQMGTGREPPVAQRAAFTLWSTVAKRMGDAAPTADEWAAYLHDKYGVESRTEMSAEQWTDLRNSLEHAKLATDGALLKLAARIKQGSFDLPGDGFGIVDAEAVCWLTPAGVLHYSGGLNGGLADQAAYLREMSRYNASRNANFDGALDARAGEVLPNSPDAPAMLKLIADPSKRVHAHALLLLVPEEWASAYGDSAADVIRTYLPANGRATA